jgi:hypothetical protein
VIYPSIGNFTRSRKNIHLGVKKPKNGIWGPKSVWLCDFSIDREFYKKREKIYFGVKKTKIGPQSPKTEFGAPDQFGRVIYPSIRNFTRSKKKYTFRGQKCGNIPLEPNKRIWGPKSV